MERRELSERGKTSLQDVVVSAKNELIEAQKQLERAKEQIREQRVNLRQEIENLLKLRDELDSQRVALQTAAEEYGKDSESLRGNFASFSELTKSLRENAEAIVHATTGAVAQLQNELSRAAESQSQTLDSFVKRRQDLSSALQSLANLSAELPRQFGQIGDEVAAVTQEIESRWHEMAASTQRLSAIVEKMEQDRISLGELSIGRGPGIANVPITCPSCGRDIRQNDQFCDRCGSTLN
jgi:DNA repair exonuclease SbcCD ATPase subunit